MKLQPAPVPRSPEALQEYISREMHRVFDSMALADLDPVSPNPLALGNNNNVNLGSGSRLARVTTNAGGSTITGIAARDDRKPFYLVNLGPADVWGA
jgi:hypothetical protein